MKFPRVFSNVVIVIKSFAGRLEQVIVDNKANRHPFIKVLREMQLSIQIKWGSFTLISLVVALYNNEISHVLLEHRKMCGR